MVRLTDCLKMTIVVDWDVKEQNKQTKNDTQNRCFSGLFITGDPDVDRA